MERRKKRGDDHVHLIGCLRENFKFNKLPTYREVFQVLLYNIRVKKETLKQSVWITIRLVKTFWVEKSRVPIIHDMRIYDKIMALYNEWGKMKRNQTRRNDTQVTKERKFVDKMDTLFDLAVPNALDLMVNEEDRKFLKAQRQPGRLGTISTSKDLTLAKQEKKAADKKIRSMQRLERQRKFKTRVESAESLHDSKVKLDDSSSTVEVDLPETPKRGRKNALTPEVLGAFDAAGISSRKASVCMSATAFSLGHDLHELNINPSSISKARRTCRKSSADNIREDFKPDETLTLHWDGKIVPDLQGPEKVDRIGIVVTGVSTDKILAAPKIQNGTGLATANVVFEIISDYNIVENIGAFSFDTTSVNTGHTNGVAALLEERLRRKVLQLACRHHVHEIILEAVFIFYLKPPGGPEIKIFHRFQLHWRNIDATQFKPGIANKTILKALKDELDEIIQFADSQLKVHQPREDYEELLCLTIIFLGGVPPKGVKFRAPGAHNKTRWMSTAIYSLKMWMFKEQFQMTKEELKGLQKVNLFIVKVYIKSWFQCPSPVGAPKNDLDLINCLKNYKKIDRSAATIALRKFSNHLWYLSETLVPLALFDRRISVKEKETCIHNLTKNQGLPDPPNRLPIYAEECHNLPDLFTTNSRMFFTILKIPDSFLSVPPMEWESNPDYLKAREVVQNLRVVNDAAERAVQHMQTYNRSLTKNENDYQDLLLTSQNFKKKVNSKKKIKSL